MRTSLNVTVTSGPRGKQPQWNESILGFVHSPIVGLFPLQLHYEKANFKMIEVCLFIYLLTYLLFLSCD